ncbi:hypothetical protein EMIT0P171_40243 [Pseudomonas sp. IT-P171]
MGLDGVLLTQKQILTAMRFTRIQCQRSRQVIRMLK